MESPGGGGGTGPQIRRSEFGIFPKPTGGGDTKGAAHPVMGKKRGRSTGARSPDTDAIRTGGWFTNTAIPMAMVGGSNIYKLLTPSQNQMDGQTRRRRNSYLRIWRGRPTM